MTKYNIKRSPQNNKIREELIQYKKQKNQTITEFYNLKTQYKKCIHENKKIPQKIRAMIKKDLPEEYTTNSFYELIETTEIIFDDEFNLFEFLELFNDSVLMDILMEIRDVVSVIGDVLKNKPVSKIRFVWMNEIWGFFYATNCLDAYCYNAVKYYHSSFWEFSPSGYGDYSIDVMG